MNWFEGQDISDKEYKWFVEQFRILSKHDDWRSVPKEVNIRCAEEVYNCNRHGWVLLYKTLMYKPGPSDYENALALLEENSNEDQHAKFLLGEHKLKGMGISRDYNGAQVMLDSASSSSEILVTIQLIHKHKLTDLYVAAYDLAKSAKKSQDLMDYFIFMQIEGKDTAVDYSAAKTNYTTLDDKHKIKLISRLIASKYDDEFILGFIEDEKELPLKALAEKIHHKAVSDDDLNILYSMALNEKPFFKEYLNAFIDSDQFSKLDILLMIFGLQRKENAILMMHSLPCLSEKYQRVHEINVEILRQFDMYCKLSGVTYMISSGTLLGAVRHGGPIPWDDDTDTYMFLDDIKRLNYYLVENDSPFYIEDYHGYGHFYKFKPTSTFIGWIDIFPLQILEHDSVNVSNDMPGIPIDRDKPQIYFTRDCHPGTIHYRYFDYDDLLPIGSITYSSLNVKAPNNPDSVLTNGYGDYWTIPSTVHNHMTDSRMDEYIQTFKRWNEEDRFTHTGHYINQFLRYTKSDNLNVYLATINLSHIPPSILSTDSRILQRVSALDIPNLTKLVETLREKCTSYTIVGPSICDVLWKIDTRESDRVMVEIAKDLSSKNVGKAMLLLGRAYRDGRGVERDSDKATEWMRKATEKSEKS